MPLLAKCKGRSSYPFTISKSIIISAENILQSEARNTNPTRWPAIIWSHPSIDVSFLTPLTTFFVYTQVLNIAEGYCVPVQFSCNCLLPVSGNTREVLKWKNARERTLAGLPPSPYSSRFGVEGTLTEWRNLQVEHLSQHLQSRNI